MILAVLSNAVIWIVSTRPPTSKSSRPFNNPFVIVPKANIIEKGQNTEDSPGNMRRLAVSQTQVKDQLKLTGKTLKE